MHITYCPSKTFFSLDYMPTYIKPNQYESQSQRSRNAKLCPQCPHSGRILSSYLMYNQQPCQEVGITQYSIEKSLKQKTQRQHLQQQQTYHCHFGHCSTQRVFSWIFKACSFHQAVCIRSLAGGKFVEKTTNVTYQLPCVPRKLDNRRISEAFSKATNQS